MNQTSTTKQPIFTKSFTINFMINFFVYLCMYLLLVIIADYSKTSYHVSDSLSGLVVGLFIIGSLIGRFGTESMSIVLVLKDFNCWFNFSNHYSVTLFYPRIDNHLDVSTTLNGIATAIATTATGTIAAHVTL